MNLFIFFVLLFQGVLMCAIVLASLVMFYLMVSSKFMCDSPAISSCGKVKIAMIEDVSRILEKRTNQVVMDLGSGWGALLLPLAKKFPQHRFIGIEHAYIPYFISKIRSRKMANISFYRQNFFDTDISKADVIFLFLLNHVMRKLKLKLKKEAKKETLFYANRFPIPGVKANKEVSFGSKYYTYYIYKGLN